ncbi:U4/U6.U5 tri-snRNP-associated protein 2 [Sarracenia purpurea var. burkii]
MLGLELSMFFARDCEIRFRGTSVFVQDDICWVLDFDFEKFCSISLSNLNVYACLVCGKYYQGRGKKSPTYTHSLEAGHHVYINLRTEKVYCLPGGYEINESSLDDIRHVLNPRFTKEQVEELDRKKQWPRALDGSDYLPGMLSGRDMLLSNSGGVPFAIVGGVPFAIVVMGVFG